MKRTLVTPPVYYPVVLAQVKKHLRVDFTNDDQYIQSLIGVAAADAEQFLRRRLITQTWKMFLDAWPAGDILLPFGQLASVTHVKYTNTADAQATWSSSTGYDVDTDSELGRIKLQYGQAYPTASLHPNNPIEIQYVCGYGANAVQAITAATNASPIVVTIVGHGYTTGDTVYIYDVTGQTAANGQWIITKASDNTFALNGSTTAGAWVSGGSCVKQSVPLAIIQAILLIIADAYENREDKIVMPGMSAVLDILAAKQRMFQYKIWEEASG